jgi:TonB family protein
MTDSSSRSSSVEPISFRFEIEEREYDLESEEEEQDDPHGQLVDVPKPVEEQEPLESDYLAEYDRTVEEETRTEEYRINPEILAEEYSREDRLELEELIDVGAIEHSTGATVGNNTFEPDRDGMLAALPSPFLITNLDGIQAPSVSSHSSDFISGAPNNDLLDEQVGTAVNLNTKEFLYANYINQIRRLVVFYWRQQLDNLPRGAQITRPSYETIVQIAIDEGGLLELVEVTDSSGSTLLDNAVRIAFQIAAPYPEPPDGLLDPDGRARLENMSFTVEVGQASSNYSGIDPRGNVQFPGILK